MRSSAVHPSESFCVASCQIGSQDGSADGEACPASYFTPEGFTMNIVRPVWSWNVSKMIWM
jgi:hypothetical protein